MVRRGGALSESEDLAGIEDAMRIQGGFHGPMHVSTAGRVRERVRCA